MIYANLTIKTWRFPVRADCRCAGVRAVHTPTRREFIYSPRASLGSVAFTSLLAAEAKKNPLVPQDGHLPAKAKHVIFLMMKGGSSHIDTFDPKPALKKLHLKECVREDKQASAMQSGKRYYGQRPFKFIRAGQSGADTAENWSPLVKAADDICFFRGCTVDSLPAPTAMYQMNCGNRFSGDPGIGAWVNYGLGTVNQDLPGFIVLPEVSYPQGGAANWSNGYLLAKLNNTHAAQHPGHDDNKLTFYHAGRFKRLSRFGGTVIKELIG